MIGWLWRLIDRSRQRELEELRALALDREEQLVQLGGALRDAHRAHASAKRLIAEKEIQLIESQRVIADLDRQLHPEGAA